METFTPLTSLLGGLLIGAASIFYWVANGRIAGISGIFGRLFERQDPMSPQPPQRTIEGIAFVAGLISFGCLCSLFGPQLFINQLSLSPIRLVFAGLLVGIGTTMGSGCTSGHGICGLSRFSKRSFFAVCSFMLSATLTVWLFGGASL